MNRWIVSVESLLSLILAVILDIVIFGPLTNSFFKAGLNSMEGLADPIVFAFWGLFGHLLGIFGFFEIILNIENILEKIRNLFRF